MPNHCYCTLEIDGPAAELTDLRQRLTVNKEGHYCLFESLIPVPEALPETAVPSLQLEHWGVNWGDCNTLIDWDQPLVLQFWTPWMPPLAGITAIAAMFPSLSLRLKYDENNCELLEIVNWADGKLVRHRAA